MSSILRVKNARRILVHEKRSMRARIGQGTGPTFPWIISEGITLQGVPAFRQEPASSAGEVFTECLPAGLKTRRARDDGIIRQLAGLVSFGR